MNPKYKHAEAFCLMRYESEDKTIVEWLWNSRDGVTPFCIGARDGKTELRHTMRHMECRPDHKPQIGDRIFIDLTKDRARAIAEKRAAALPDLWKERYPSAFEQEQALEEITESIYHNGESPDIVTVTKNHVEGGMANEQEIAEVLALQPGATYRKFTLVDIFRYEDEWVVVSKIEVGKKGWSYRDAKELVKYLRGQDSTHTPFGEEAP